MFGNIRLYLFESDYYYQSLLQSMIDETIYQDMFDLLSVKYVKIFIILMINYVLSFKCYEMYSIFNILYVFHINHFNNKFCCRKS